MLIKNKIFFSFLCFFSLNIFGIQNQGRYLFNNLSKARECFANFFGYKIKASDYVPEYLFDPFIRFGEINLNVYPVNYEKSVFSKPVSMGKCRAQTFRASQGGSRKNLKVNFENRFLQYQDPYISKLSRNRVNQVSSHGYNSSSNYTSTCSYDSGINDYFDEVESPKSKLESHYRGYKDSKLSDREKQALRIEWAKEKQTKDKDFLLKEKALLDFFSIRGFSDLSLREQEKKIKKLKNKENKLHGETSYAYTNIYKLIYHRSYVDQIMEAEEWYVNRRALLDIAKRRREEVVKLHREFRKIRLNRMRSLNDGNFPELILGRKVRTGHVYTDEEFSEFPNSLYFHQVVEVMDSFLKRRDIVYELESLESICKWIADNPSPKKSYFKGTKARKIVEKLTKKMEFFLPENSTIIKGYYNIIENFGELSIQNQERMAGVFQDIKEFWHDATKEYSQFFSRIKMEVSGSKDKEGKSKLIEEKIMPIQYQLINSKAHLNIFNRMSEQANKIFQSNINRENNILLSKELEELTFTDQVLDMIAIKKESFFQDVDPIPYEEGQISKEFQNQRDEKKEYIDPNLKILKKITSLCQEKVVLNDEASNYYYDKNNLDHEKVLRRLMKAAKRVCDQDALSELKTKTYDLSEISRDTLKHLDISRMEKLVNVSDLQGEMLKVVFDFAKEMDTTRQEYSGKKSVQRLVEGQLSTLKKIIQHVKSDNLEQALHCLEESWNRRGALQGLCFCCDTVDDVKVIAKGLYSGLKRSINIPQRIKDVYRSVKILSKVVSRIYEIDVLVEVGDIEQAEQKYEALKQDFFTVVESLKNKWNISNRSDKLFFLGEIIGDISGIKLTGIGCEKVFNLVSPKVTKCVQKAAEVIGKGFKRTRKKTGPITKTTVVTPEGITMTMDGLEQGFVRGAKTTSVNFKPNVAQKLPLKTEATLQNLERAKSFQKYFSERMSLHPPLSFTKSRGLKIFDRVHIFDCVEIYKRYGNKLKITNDDLIKGLRHLNINEIKWDSDSLKHIFGIERRANGKIGGYHVDYKLQGAKVKAVNFDKIARDPQTGLIVLRIPKNKGGFSYKTLFHESNCNEKAFGKVLEAINNQVDKIKISGSRAAFDCLSKDGLAIRIVVENNGKIVTAFPPLETSYCETLNFVDIERFL